MYKIDSVSMSNNDDFASLNSKYFSLEEHKNILFYFKNDRREISYIIKDKVIFISDLNTNQVLQLKSKTSYQDIFDLAINELSSVGFESLFEAITSDTESSEGIYHNDGKDIAYYLFKEDYILYNPYKELDIKYHSKVYSKVQGLNKHIIFRMVAMSQIKEAYYRLLNTSTKFIEPSTELEFGAITINLNTFHYFMRMLFENPNYDFDFKYHPIDENVIYIHNNGVESFYLKVEYPEPTQPKIKLESLKKGDVVLDAEDENSPYYIITKYPSNAEIEITEAVRLNNGKIGNQRQYKYILKETSPTVKLIVNRERLIKL